MVDYSRSEEGLQAALAERERAQRAGDKSAEADAVIALVWLVKWVRSNTCEPPFERAFALAHEALELYRSCGNRRGEARALLRAVAMFDPDSNLKRIEQAEAIAMELGDKDLLAQSTAARGRILGMRDQKAARSDSLKALGLYEELGDERGQAMCHFTLVIQCDDREEKLRHCLSAFTLYRKSGDTDEAARALQLVSIVDPTDEELTILEPHFLTALQGAVDRGDAAKQIWLLKFLAKVASVKGDLDKAVDYRERAGAILDPNDLGPREQWEQDLYFTQLLLNVAKQNGQTDAARDFQEELRKLRKNRPR